MSVVDMLRYHNPARTAISIHLRDETSDADLAEALEQNPFVTEIRVELERRAASQLEFFAACDCDARQPRKSVVEGCSLC